MLDYSTPIEIYKVDSFFVLLFLMKVNFILNSVIKTGLLLSYFLDILQSRIKILRQFHM